VLIRQRFAAQEGLSIAQRLAGILPEKSAYFLEI